MRGAMEEILLNVDKQYHSWSTFRGLHQFYFNMCFLTISFSLNVTSIYWLLLSTHYCVGTIDCHRQRGLDSPEGLLKNAI